MSKSNVLIARIAALTPVLLVCSLAVGQPPPLGPCLGPGPLTVAPPAAAQMVAAGASVAPEGSMSLLVPVFNLPDPGNGPLSGTNGHFFFGTNSPATGSPPKGNLWWYNANNNFLMLLPWPTNAQVDTTGAPIGPAGQPLRWYNNLESGFVTDDSPQSFSGATAGSQAIHHPRHGPHPVNAGIVYLIDDLSVPPPGGSNVILAAPVKCLPNQASPAIWDARIPAIAATHVRPSIVANPLPAPSPSEHVLSELNTQVSTLASPLSIAYVTGHQLAGDFSDGGVSTSAAPSALRIIDVSTPGAPIARPVAPFGNGGSGTSAAFSPYATKITVWPRRAFGSQPFNSSTPQFVLVPLRDGVEIYLVASVATTPPSTTFPSGFIPTTSGFEICSNVEYFGDDPANIGSPLFIVLERQGPSIPSPLPGTSGVRFKVFNLLGATASGGFTSPSVQPPGGRALDITRGGEIVVAPKTQTLGQYTAFVPLYDSRAGQFGATIPYGMMASIQNIGLGTYTDGGLGINVVGAFPIRYHAPTLVGGIAPTSVVPIGAPSTLPVFDPVGGGTGGLTGHPNFVAWLYCGIFSGSAGFYGVAVVDCDTFATSTLPASAPATIMTSTLVPEPVNKRPRWGYVNNGTDAILFAPGPGALSATSNMIPFKITKAAGTPTIMTLGAFAPPFAPTTVKRQIGVFNPPLSAHPQVAATCVGFADSAVLVMDDAAMPKNDYFDTIVASWSLAGGPVLWPAAPGLIPISSGVSTTPGPIIAVDNSTNPTGLLLSPMYYRIITAPVASTFSSGLVWLPPTTPVRLIDFLGTSTPAPAGPPSWATQWVANGGNMVPQHTIATVVTPTGPTQFLIAGQLQGQGPTGPTPQLWIVAYANTTCGASPPSLVQAAAAPVLLTPGDEVSTEILAL